MPQKFCASLLSLLPSGVATDSSAMSCKLQIEALTALRIASREPHGITELPSEGTMKKLLRLSGLTDDVGKAFTEINHDNLTMQGNNVALSYVCIYCLI